MATVEAAPPTTGRRFAARWADELRPGVLANSAATAAAVYGVEIVAVVALAALVFSGRLAGQLPAGLGFVLVGEAALCAVVALPCSYPGSIAIAQDTSAVLHCSASSPPRRRCSWSAPSGCC
jgi:hypothetical protein